MCDIITPGTYYKKGYYTHWSSIKYTPPELKRSWQQGYSQSQHEKNASELEEWCLDNLEGKVCITTGFVCFELDSDLMAFRLGYE